MSTNKDGGPAFPVVTNQYHFGFDESMPAAVSGGMTLRDYFAAKAMQVVHAPSGRYGPEGLQQVAEQSYAVADAMLKAREA
jgi:hypothetical protein